MITVSECKSKNNIKPTLKTINPFKFIKEHSNPSYIIGRFVYEQEPCQVTIDCIIDEHISLEELTKVINDELLSDDLLYDKVTSRDILYIPYSVFENYMDTRIDDYVDSGEYKKYNDPAHHDSIYKYEFIAIDLRR